MLYIRSLECVYLITDHLYPLMNHPPNNKRKPGGIVLPDFIILQWYSNQNSMVLA